MRGFNALVLGLVLSGWGSSLAGSEEHPAIAQALVGATLVDGTGGAPMADAVVLLADGKVQCAGSRQACPVPGSTSTMDLSGHWITPGIVDAHVHFSQTAWADGRPDSLDVRPIYPYAEVQADLRAHPERWYRAYLCSGVTAVFDVGGYPWTWGLRESSETDTAAPHVAAAGPLLSTLDFWLNLPAERQFVHLANRESAQEGVAYLAAHRSDAVKVWFIPTRGANRDERDVAVLAAGEEAARHRVPLIVHATGLREAKIAVRAGARLLVHSVWDQPVDQEFVDLALAKGTIYCPTLTVGAGYLRMWGSSLNKTPPAVDDPNGCVDQRTLSRVAETARLGSTLDLSFLSAEALAARTRRGDAEAKVGAENLKRLHDAGVPIAMGTDAGNPLTLHGPSIYAEMEAMQKAGLTPTEVLVASTCGGARAMGRQADLGTVEAGKVADLLVVGADPTRDIANLRQVRYVVRGGVVRALDELKP